MHVYHEDAESTQPQSFQHHTASTAFPRVMFLYSQAGSSMSHVVEAVKQVQHDVCEQDLVNALLTCSHGQLVMVASCRVQRLSLKQSANCLRRCKVILLPSRHESLLGGLQIS